MRGAFDGWTEFVQVCWLNSAFERSAARKKTKRSISFLLPQTLRDGPAAPLCVPRSFPRVRHAKAASDPSRMLLRVGRRAALLLAATAAFSRLRDPDTAVYVSASPPQPPRQAFSSAAAEGLRSGTCLFSPYVLPYPFQGPFSPPPPSPLYIGTS